MFHRLLKGTECIRHFGGTTSVLNVGYIIDSVAEIDDEIWSIGTARAREVLEQGKRGCAELRAVIVPMVNIGHEGEAQFIHREDSIGAKTILDSEELSCQLQSVLSETVFLLSGMPKSAVECFDQRVRCKLTCTRESVSTIPERIDACVIDLDGTLTVGNEPTCGASELIEAAGAALVVLSNNSSHDADSLSRELARLGLLVPADRILLAGAEAVAMLARKRPGQRVLLLASPTIQALAVGAGLVPDDENPDTVLVARDECFDYERLHRAVNAVRRGAELVAANGDLTHPGPEGTVVPETGSLLAAVRACCTEAPCSFVGKPHAPLFEAALRRLGTRPETTLMIGDNDATDGEGAIRMGMPFLHVHDCDVREAAALVRARRV